MSDIPATPGPNAPAEPLITVGAITGIAAAVVGAGVAFGLDLTHDQTTAILAIIGVLAPVVVTVWGRTKVFSPATVRTMVVASKRKKDWA